MTLQCPKAGEIYPNQNEKVYSYVTNSMSGSEIFLVPLDAMKLWNILKIQGSYWLLKKT
jgi:hypothetical protein